MDQRKEIMAEVIRCLLSGSTQAQTKYGPQNPSVLLFSTVYPTHRGPEEWKQKIPATGITLCTLGP